MPRRYCMRKILLCLVLLLAMLLGCSKVKESYSYSLSVQEVLDKIENQEDFVVYLGTTTCTACQTFAPIAEKMNENYQTQIYHVVLDLEEDEELKDQLLAIIPVEYTPSINAIKDGVLVGNYEGVLEYIDLKEFMTKYEFIK